jgi:hypothetical protein
MGKDPERTKCTVYRRDGTINQSIESILVNEAISRDVCPHSDSGVIVALSAPANKRWQLNTSARDHYQEQHWDCSSDE